VDRLKAVSQMLSDETHTLARQHLHIRHICMEGYSRNSTHRREEAGELGAIVKLTLAAAYPVLVGYPTIVPPTVLKQFVSGKGNASKSDMLKGVEKKWGLKLTDHNKADAYGLARMAKAIDRGTYNFLYPYEKKALQKLVLHTEATGG
jgi:Holliday junction resolvasome RuvABC endonuclease subunit